MKSQLEYNILDRESELPVTQAEIATYLQNLPTPKEDAVCEMATD